ncbi:glutathione S-transferase family protein [Aestuariivirga sp.]|uniref:glutathione S-transferase family protein n=1 Tax=Aestuariivirga sp. TaxID=2650926 RepID=UPI003BA882C1
MYKLYNVKCWGSLAIHCLLEEMEVPYTNIWMTPEQVRESSFRAISPLGEIPALGLPDGRTLFESGAIVSFLIAAHPEKHLSPPLGSEDYGEFMSLLYFMSLEIYGYGNVAYSAGALTQDEVARDYLQARVREKVESYWQFMEKRLVSAGPWLMGRDFSAIDIYCFMLTLWASPSEEALHGKFPALAKLTTAVRARPKLKAVLESHGVLTVGGYGG